MSLRSVIFDLNLIHVVSMPLILDIFPAKMSNITKFRLLSWEDLLLIFDLYDSEVNGFGFCAVSQKKNSHLMIST